MEADADDSQPLAVRAQAILRIVYTKLRHWSIGLSPEDYHWAMATAWEELGNFRRATKHLLIYLLGDEDPYVRTLLGSCYARMGYWPEAVVEYTKALDSWPHHTVLLALAEAKLRLGDFMKARELIDLVEREHSALEHESQENLTYLRDELAAGPEQSSERAGEL